MALTNFIKANDHYGWLLKLIKSDDGNIYIKGGKDTLFIDYNPIRKLKNHRFVSQDEIFIILFDGIAFNKDELIKRYKTDSWEDTLKVLWQNDGYQFAELIKGSFCGFIIDLKSEVLILFLDHIGSHAVYYQIDENIKISSDIAKILDDNIQYGHKNYLDINSAYSLLSCGFMLDNNTLCSSIKKLTPGCVFGINNNYEEIQYYSINNEVNAKITEIDAVLAIDKLFHSAVEQQYKADLKGRYFPALSGGLDSRMTSLVAHKLGFTQQLNFTFSQSMYLDQTIAEQIASDHNHDFLFKSLDTGNYLLDVDEITEFTGGLVLYYGLGHGNSLLKLLDLSNYGIMHSGQLGDVIVGTYSSTNNPNKPYNFSDGAFGHNLLNKIDKSNLKHYPNEEIGKFYNRGFNGILTSGHTVIQQSMETYSPFYDREFMDFCLSLPLNFRRNHYIYKNGF